MHRQTYMAKIDWTEGVLSVAALNQGRLCGRDTTGRGYDEEPEAFDVG